MQANYERYFRHDNRLVKVNLFFSNCDRIFNSCDSFLHILRYSDIIISILYGDKAKHSFSSFS